MLFLFISVLFYEINSMNSSFPSDIQQLTRNVLRCLGEACHLLRQTSYRKWLISHFFHFLYDFRPCSYHLHLAYCLTVCQTDVYLNYFNYSILISAFNAWFQLSTLNSQFSKWLTTTTSIVSSARRNWQNSPACLPERSADICRAAVISSMRWAFRRMPGCCHPRQ